MLLGSVPVEVQLTALKVAHTGQQGVLQGQGVGPASTGTTCCRRDRDITVPASHGEWNPGHLRCVVLHAITILWVPVPVVVHRAPTHKGHTRVSGVSKHRKKYKVKTAASKSPNSEKMAEVAVAKLFLP